MPPKGKHKAAPKPTAASELASALGAAKFSRIKHGDLQHEANAKRSFTVPRPGNLGVHILQVAILLPPAPALVCVPGGRTGAPEVAFVPERPWLPFHMAAIDS